MDQYQQTNNDLAHTLGRIEGTLERFDETLVRFDHKLFGNGQPGEISKIEDRLGTLETFKSYIKGGFALVTLIGVTELYHLFVGRK